MAKESYERPVMTVILLSGTNVVLTSCVINLCNTNEDEESCFGYMGQGMCGGYGNAGLCPANCMDTGDTCENFPCENFPCEGTDGGGGGYCGDFGCSSDEGICSAYDHLPCEENPGGGWCSSDCGDFGCSSDEGICSANNPLPCEDNPGGGWCSSDCGDYGCSSDEGICSAYNPFPCEDNPGGGWCSSDY